jgi:TPR repeat protein
MRNRILGLVCLLFSVFPVVADEWDDAVLAFDAQRYDDVLKLLAPLAEPNNVAAQLLLFDTYTKGQAALTDDAAKFEWTRRAAKLGIAPAQEHLAQDYLYGRDVPADEMRAAKLFTQAADQWYPPAIYNLAVMTMNGQGVPADPDYAVGLLHRAASLNEPYALYVLGGMYLEGRYVAPDEDLGFHYLAQAAFFGQRRAMAILGILIAERATDPNRLVKSAFHFRRALAAGCTDLDQLATDAIDRLSSEEVEMLEFNLADWAADMAPHDMDLPAGPCLTE